MNSVLSKNYIPDFFNLNTGFQIMDGIPKEC